MKISALTTCVGEKYARYLEKSLPIWLDTLDELFVVTDDKTVDFNPWLSANIVHHRARVVRTKVFTEHGASFNKGAALSAAFAYIQDPQWILNFDADILPPKNWREIVEPKLKIGNLHGCSHRYREDQTLIPDADFPNIWGFFHLWHVDDPHSWRRPVFDVTCGHAGNYDHSFMMQWPEKCRTDLWPELKVIHQGEPRQQWFGGDKRNDKKMFSLFNLGLFDAWQQRAGHIKVPEPQSKVVVKNSDLTLEQSQALLREFTHTDPFKYHLEIKGGKNVSTHD